MTLRAVRNLVGITGIAFIFYLILTQLEKGLLQDMVYPIAGISIDNWIEQFSLLGFIGLIVAWISSLLWYITAEWFLKINSSKRSGGRIIWFLIFAMPIVTAGITILLIPGAQKGYFFSAVLQFVNITMSYYLATVFFSPSAFKFTPLGAKFLRRW